MKYVCDAHGGKTWFRIETEAEAVAESGVMRHNVEKYFCQEKDKATKTFQPPSRVLFEQEIGLSAHIQREMPLFLTLRDAEGNALVTAMRRTGGAQLAPEPRSSATCASSSWGNQSIRPWSSAKRVSARSQPLAPRPCKQRSPPSKHFIKHSAPSRRPCSIAR